LQYRNLHGRACVVFIALISLAAVLAACGSTTKNSNVQSSAQRIPLTATGTTPDGAVLLVVTANDFSFALNRTTVPAGRVHVQLINQSTYNQHEVWVYPQNQPQLQELLAAKRAGKQIDEQDYLHGLAGHVEDVPPGQTAAFDVTLQPARCRRW
jgi:hypothetical protein